jgi:hypothetical protein
MANDIQIQRTVLNSTAFTKVVDTSFSTFTQPETTEEQDTPEELFRLYDKLYFDLDVTGPTNSHEYLVKRSSELANFDTTTEDIQPLLDEIAQLREQLLLANQQILTLETKTT